MGENKMESKLGHAAVAFSLKDTEGKTHTLKDGIGDWQLLVFHRHLG